MFDTYHSVISFHKIEKHRSEPMKLVCILKYCKRIKKVHSFMHQMMCVCAFYCLQWITRDIWLNAFHLYLIPLSYHIYSNKINIIVMHINIFVMLFLVSFFCFLVCLRDNASDKNYWLNRIKNKFGIHYCIFILIRILENLEF